LDSFKIAHPSLVIKKDVLKKLNYNVNFKISSDTDFLIRLLQLKKLNYRHIERYFVFMLSGGLSTSYKNILNKFFEDIKIYFNHFNYLGLFIYAYKILSKLQGFLVKKKDINKLKMILAQNIKNL
jgi:glycosyltransferase